MSHTNESYHIRMSHVTYEWVMSHTNASCRIRMSHVTYKWVMPTCEWVMSHGALLCVFRLRCSAARTIHATHDGGFLAGDIGLNDPFSQQESFIPVTHSCNTWRSLVTYERVTRTGDSFWKKENLQPYISRQRALHSCTTWRGNVTNKWVTRNLGLFRGRCRAET